MLVSNHWTGPLDLPILPLLVRAEAKRAYYLSPRIGIGQRSHAYLISFNKVLIDTILFYMLQSRLGIGFCSKYVVSALLIFSLQFIQYARDL